MRYKSFTAMIFIMASGVAQANSVTNGNFETGDPTPTGWTVNVSAGNGVVSDALFRTDAGATGTFPTGHYAFVFGGGNTPDIGVLTQNIATNPGQEYNLTLDYGKLDYGSSPQSLLIQAINLTNNQSILNTVITVATGESNLALLFSNYSFFFVANSSTTELSFSDVSTGTWGTDGILDNVSVTPVVSNTPIPAAIWLVGSALIGLVGFARRKLPL